MVSGRIFMNTTIAGTTFFLTEAHNVPGYNQLINRFTQIYNDNSIEQFWYLGDRIHRVDGPATLITNSNNEVIEGCWIINERCLYNFHEYFSKSNIVESIFNYIEIYPHLIDQVIMIVKANNWFDETQLLLLQSMNHE